MIRLAHPWWLALALLVIARALMLWRDRRARIGAFGFSSLSLVDSPRALRIRTAILPFIVELLALLLIVVALARPQRVTRLAASDRFGIDIVIALDSSGSMAAEDFVRGIDSPWRRAHRRVHPRSPRRSHRPRHLRHARGDAVPIRIRSAHHRGDSRPRGDRRARARDGDRPRARDRGQPAAHVEPQPRDHPRHGRREQRGLARAARCGAARGA
jgi:hypothetical protein